MSVLPADTEYQRVTVWLEVSLKGWVDGPLIVKAPPTARKPDTPRSAAEYDWCSEYGTALAAQGQVQVSEDGPAYKIQKVLLVYNTLTERVLS